MGKQRAYVADRESSFPVRLKRQRRSDGTLMTVICPTRQQVRRYVREKKSVQEE